jgi:Transposase DDE domain
MPSNSILNAAYAIVQKHVLPQVPPIWLRQVRFGLETLALQPFVSGNANARASGLPRGTAENKMDRLLANPGLPAALAKITLSLGQVTPASFVNADHSDFNGLVALAFAVQSRKGRALPVFLDTAYSGKLSARDDAPKRTQVMRAAYNMQEQDGDETSRTLATLKDFREALGFWPKLVFDRGFGNKDIVELLHGQGATFYIRMKAGRYVELGGDRQQLKTLPKKDSLVTLYGLTLRVVRSPKNGKDDEPWYILTNDLKRSRSKVVRIYYYRFEIEETFRDVKSILGLGKTRFMQPNSLAVLLWFVSLGVLLLHQGGLTALGAHLWRQLKPRGHKKRISWFRLLYELREREIRQSAFGRLTGVGVEVG